MHACRRGRARSRRPGILSNNRQCSAIRDEPDFGPVNAVFTVNESKSFLRHSMAFEIFRNIGHTPSDRRHFTGFLRIDPKNGSLLMIISQLVRDVVKMELFFTERHSPVFIEE